ncbi:alcohol dehydrogenase catalytic domain-containing protein, partial [Candidatus Neomarinimicrobiota bacterium]
REAMKAAFLYTDNPSHIEIEDVIKPACGINEVLLKIIACAICGTDGRMYSGTKDATKNAVPQYKGYGDGKYIIGHEIVGVVEEIGSEVSSSEYQVGDKVILVTSVGCQEKSCQPCRDGLYHMCKNNQPIGYYYPGGFAEYMLVQESSVRQKAIIPVPAECTIPDEHLVMVEPLSCVINGQNYLNIKPGETVTVVGAGPIGILHALRAKSQGAEVILAEYSSRRIDTAKSFNFDHYIHTAETSLAEGIMNITHNTGTDVGIVACSSTSVVEEIFGAMAMLGRLSIFGGLPKENSRLDIDGNIIHYKEVSLFGAFASNRPQFEQALKEIVNGSISMSAIVTHSFALDDIVEAMEKMLDKEGTALKVVIKP